MNMYFTLSLLFFGYWKYILAALCLPNILKKQIDRWPEENLLYFGLSRRDYFDFLGM